MRVKKPFRAQQLLLLIQPFLSLSACSTLIEISAGLWSKRWAPLISEGLNKSQEAFLIEGTGNGSAPVCQIQISVMGLKSKYAGSTSLGSSGLGHRKQLQPLHWRLPETRSQGILATLEMQLSWQSWLFLLMWGPQNLCGKAEQVLLHEGEVTFICKMSAAAYCTCLCCHTHKQAQRSYQ